MTYNRHTPNDNTIPVWGENVVMVGHRVGPDAIRAPHHIEAVRRPDGSYQHWQVELLTQSTRHAIVVEHWDDELQQMTRTHFHPHRFAGLLTNRWEASHRWLGSRVVALSCPGEVEAFARSSWNSNRYGGGDHDARTFQYTVGAGTGGGRVPYGYAVYRYTMMGSDASCELSAWQLQRNQEALAEAVPA